mmetsp:Transcript_71217/g.112849  ORF Transcript_71217/g.112849 Transcript_71217/m.112849 type:complete len:161 (-) Transcript_71217:1242-1724(-)
MTPRLLYLRVRSRFALRAWLLVKHPSLTLDTHRKILSETAFSKAKNDPKKDPKLSLLRLYQSNPAALSVALEMIQDVALLIIVAVVELGMKIVRVPPHGARSDTAKVIQKELQMLRTGLSSTRATQATQATHLWCDPRAMWSELGNGLKGGQRTKMLNFS